MDLGPLSCVVAAAALVSSVPQAAGAKRDVIRVPQDEPTLAAAVAAARSDDTIVLDRGTYGGGIVVPAAKRGLTIVGVDRNDVVFDGGDTRRTAIVVHADDVSILNVGAHNYLGDAFLWEDVVGFRASYLTVWNVQGYGIYAEGSSNGVIDHDYVSGAADAAYYIGECRRCRSTIAHVVAALSAVGYSGTNASGVVIRDSLWDRNGAGIVPNTFANEKFAPQRAAVIERNTVTASGRARVPINTALAGFIGIGIAVAGGNDNSIANNLVRDSERYGIAIFHTPYRVVFGSQLPAGPRWRPRGNVVARNSVSGSGRADLALARGAGRGNCFFGNRVRKTLPRALQRTRCARTGDAGVARVLTAPIPRMVAETHRRRQPPPYTAMPQPPNQPNMPNAPRP